MRGWLSGLVILGLVFTAGHVVADEQSEARAVIDNGLKALGGEAKLAKLQGATFRGKATAMEGGVELTITGDTSWQGLDHCRLDLEAQVMGRAQKALLVVAGDKAWALTDGKVEEAPKEIMGILQGDFYALRLAQMLTPLKDAAYTLSPLGEVKIGERTGLGVKTKRKDSPEVDLFFDKENGLLLKFELRVQEMGGNEVNHEFLLSDYKEVDGLKHFGKMTLNRDGKKMMELELNDFKREEKLDESLFGKPG